jgi:hypothetical protein
VLRDPVEGVGQRCRTGAVKPAQGKPGLRTRRRPTRSRHRRRTRSRPAARGVDPAVAIHAVVMPAGPTAGPRAAAAARSRRAHQVEGKPASSTAPTSIPAAGDGLCILPRSLMIRQTSSWTAWPSPTCFGDELAERRGVEVEPLHPHPGTSSGQISGLAASRRAACGSAPRGSSTRWRRPASWRCHPAWTWWAPRPRRGSTTWSGSCSTCAQPGPASNLSASDP